MVQNFENFALVNMSKLVISKPDISKTDISDLLKRTLMCTFQEGTNFIFKNHRRNIGKKWVKTTR